VTGFLCEPGNVAQFAERLTTLVCDDGVRRNLAQAARERSLEFGWDQTMARLLGYYRTLLTDEAL
jgi:glycosyltransferase involved in cell wall biosynthesis